MATERVFKYAVWYTQGGGLVRRVGGQHIFVEKPHPSVGLDVGDDMPEEWGLAPANDIAMQEMEASLWSDFDKAEVDYTHRGHRTR